jgi:hypothetical protein
MDILTLLVALKYALEIAEAMAAKDQNITKEDLDKVDAMVAEKLDAWKKVNQ